MDSPKAIDKPLDICQNHEDALFISHFPCKVSFTLVNSGFGYVDIQYLSHQAELYNCVNAF